MSEQSKHRDPILVGQAIALAAAAHRHTVNKDGTPYILHPMRLALQCDDEDGQIVAILHDTVEDTDVTMEQLETLGVWPHCLEAINALTKREGEDYADFIERIAFNPLATRIKLLDIEDNINLLRLEEVGDWELQRTAKYHRAWKRLRAVQAAEKA